jgi:hypothetical protein
MTREQAEIERKRMAEEHPESTWLVAEQEPGEWALVKVGLKPADSDNVESTEERPRPANADDPRTSQMQNTGPWVGGA